LSIYDYYAGYSQGFIRDILRHLSLREDARIVDPWNGSGTTTHLAELMGFSAFGYDVNPAMVIVAKAKRVSLSHDIDLTSICRKILEKARGYRRVTFIENDGLGQWLQPSSVSIFRDIERAIQELLSEPQIEHSTLSIGRRVAEISNEAAFFYTALFRVVRDTLRVFRSSNPTWIKVPKTNHSRLRPSANHIRSLFEHHVGEMIEALKGYHSLAHSKLKKPTVNIEVASSRAIPLPTNHIDAVIASPPYCTRIDYVVATKPELAILGYSTDEDLKALRAQMIGTPTITGNVPPVQTAWGCCCREFLNNVTSHSSVASAGYYLKTYLQYFDSIYSSLTEINRILKRAGQCVLVVQDSYYKEIHNDLPLVFIEMGHSLGWLLKSRDDFIVKHTMADINGKAKKYRSHANTIESVLIFQKAA
jgi:hypothetical protein